MKVNILGEYYKIIDIKKGDREFNCCDGFCDETVKTIGVKKYEQVAEPGDVIIKANLERQRKKVIRHEIIHAFLHESGLAENSDWAQIEEMVDFFAIQFPKLQKAFEEAKAI